MLISAMAATNGFHARVDELRVGEMKSVSGKSANRTRDTVMVNDHPKKLEVTPRVRSEEDARKSCQSLIPIRSRRTRDETISMSGSGG